MPRAPRQKRPKHTVEVRAYAFPLQVTPAESARLHAVLDVCHELRETLVQERSENRTEVREALSAGLPAPAYVTKGDQYRRIQGFFHIEPRYKAVHSQVLQNVADRIEEGTKRWFKALRDRRTDVRPPHSQPRKKCRSFTYTQYGTAAFLRDGRVHLSKLGSFRVFDYRKMRGRRKAVTVKFRDGRWWVIITCELQAKDCYEAASARPNVGGDPGLANSLALSDGTVLTAPRPLQKALKDLKHEQRAMARKFDARKTAHAKESEVARARGETPVPLREVPYSNRLRNQITRVAKKHTKVARVRDNAHKKNGSVLKARYGCVAIEHHGVKFMAANRRTSRSAADVALAGQRHAIRSALGPDRYREVPTVRPGICGNSQTCLCGARVPKTLRERWHSCSECGIEGDRDWVSALIVEHTAFGTVNDQAARVLGQRVLEQALRLLERRGEDEVRRGETRTGRVATPVESSGKRPPRASSKARRTAGGKPTAAGKTAGHRARTLPAAPKPSLGGPEDGL